MNLLTNADKHYNDSTYIFSTDDGVNLEYASNKKHNDVTDDYTSYCTLSYRSPQCTPILSCSILFFWNPFLDPQYTNIDTLILTKKKNLLESWFVN